MYNKDFGDYLKKLRIEAGYTSQRQFGLAVGISSASISRIESNDQQAEPDTIKKMAPFLKVPYQELLKAAGYIDTEVKIEDMDEDVRLIARAGQKMTPEQRKKLIDVTRALFPEVFDDDHG